MYARQEWLISSINWPVIRKWKANKRQGRHKNYPIADCWFTTLKWSIKWNNIPSYNFIFKEEVVPNSGSLFFWLVQFLTKLIDCQHRQQLPTIYSLKKIATAHEYHFNHRHSLRKRLYGDWCYDWQTIK